MKTSLTRVLLVTCAFLLAFSPSASAHTDLTASQARDMINSAADLIVVDVREQYEYCNARGHIPGSLNYPWNSAVLQARYAERPADGPVLVVCASGGRSNAAANFLDSKGFSTVYDMKAGMSAWQWETAPCKYSGGSGTAKDPYQIATAADLIALGEDPNDYDKHFILTADIDLDPNLPGRKVFNKAVIAPDTDPNDVHPWYEATPFIGPAFTGVFDGKGHTILRLTITGTRYLGLFGGLGSAGEVKNLGVVDVNITGSGDSIGGLVGTSNHASVVAQCYITGSVSGKGYIGGLAGYNGGIVTQCYSTAAVQGARTTNGYDGGVGGLVGENFGTLADCYSIGSVGCYSPNSYYRVKSTAGGLVGRNGMLANSWAIVTDCFWDAETSGQLTSNGGMGLTTAEMQNAGTFLTWGTCGNEGTWTINDGRDYPKLRWQNMPGEPIALGATLSDLLTGEGTEDSPYLIYTPDDLSLIGLFACEWDKHYRLMADIDMSGFDGKDGRPPFNIIAPGHLAGFEEVLSFRGIPFTGLFDGNGYVISHLTVEAYECGGLIGGLGPGGEVRNVGITDVNITGSGYDVGGLVGWNEGAVTGCYSTGTVGGSSDIGGLAGINYRGSMTQCHSAATVSGTDSVGGLVGCNLGDTVNQCFATGAVSGGWMVGGLVGYNNGRIVASRSSGVISGDGCIGGLVGGSEYKSSITQCYSTGSVSGESCVGGLAGGNWHGNMTQCYSTGIVSGVSEVGGLLAYNYAHSGTVTNCFWDTQTSGQATSAAGTGKTTAEMQTAGTFLEAGWDFVGETANGTEDIWWILEGQDYPRLWWENHSN